MGNALVDVRFDSSGLRDLASNKVWEMQGTVNFDNAGLFGGKCAYSEFAGYFTSKPDERLVFGKKDFTVSFWVKPMSDAGRGAMGVFGNVGPGSNYGDAFHASVVGSSDITFSNYKVGYYDFGWFTCPLLELEKWHHIAFVRKDGIFYLFADGVLGSTKDDIKDLEWQFGASLHSLMTSAYCENIAYYPLNGYLDDFVILDYALWTEDFTPPKDYLTGGGSEKPEPEVGISLPAGALMYFAMPTAPTGWLECDGSEVSKTQYKNLFEAIGNIYGEASMGNFRLPDLRGEFLRGIDNARGLDQGRLFGSVQADALQNHFHGGVVPATTGAFSGSNASSANGMLLNANADQLTPARVADETRPHNVAVLSCIKY